MRQRSLASIAALGAVGVLASAASADVETQTLDFMFPLSPGGTTLTFDQFDDQGGLRELKSVKITIDGEIGANIVAENDSDLPAPDFSVAIVGQLSVDFADLSAMAMFDEVFASGGLAPSDGVEGSGPDFFDFGFVSAAGSADDMVMGSPAELADFIGNGTIDADVAGAGSFVFFGATDVSFQITNFMALGTVTVEYTYNLIPAPSGLALLMGVGLAGRRRRRA